MSIHADHGIVLGAIPYSNTSLVASVLTEKEGKIRLVAKGARSPKSRFGSSLEPATCVYLEWWKRPGADLGTLRACEGLTVFRRLWTDLEAMGCGGRLLKTMDRLLGMNEGETEHFKLLGAALEAIESGERLGSVEGIFLVMLLKRMGLAPGLRYCRDCEKRPGEESSVLDFQAGELRCSQCRLRVVSGMRLRAGTVATMAEALRLPCERLRSIKVLPSLQGELIRAARAFLAYHTGLPAIASPSGGKPPPLPN